MPETSLLDALTTALAPKSVECPFPALLASLPDNEATLLRAALKPKTIASDKLRKILAAAGHEMAEQRIRDHRAGSCSCRSQTT